MQRSVQHKMRWPLTTRGAEVVALVARAQVAGWGARSELAERRVWRRRPIDPRGLPGWLVTAFAAVGMLGAACVPMAAPPTAAPDQGQPVPGGRVVVARELDASTLNPVLATDITSLAVLSRVYESLLVPNQDTGIAEPRLAQTFEASPDGTTLQFTLRDGLQWSDGSPFSGDDFQFTVEATMRSAKTLRKSAFQDIVGARDYATGAARSISGITVNGTTITVRLAQPSCPALLAVGAFPIIPKKVFGKYLDPDDASKNLDDAPENTAPTLATGPFTFKEWVPNDHVTLVRNDRFFLGKPLLDEWVWRTLPNAAALPVALKAHEVDVALVAPQDFDELKSDASLQGYPYPVPQYTYIGWNQLRGGKEFFRSKNVRQALTYGLNVDQFVTTVLAGHATRTVTQTPSISWAFDPSGLNAYPYTPSKAEELLQQDGWARGADGVYQKSGQRLDFTLLASAGTRTGPALQQVAVEQYQQIGVHVTPESISNEALVDRLTRSRDAMYGGQGGRDFDAVITSSVLGPEPDAFMAWHSSQITGGRNYVGYRNPVVDQALETGRSACNQADRQAAYHTLDLQLNDDQPVNFGFDLEGLAVADKKVHGIRPGPFTMYGGVLFLFDVERWWIK